ncbi:MULTISPECIES: AMP-binding protein [Bacillus]|uniref:AMP-binding protein n=1 Tax=Bacillus TaxID=1386 RepID=UPI000362C9A3|nr:MULTISPECIES: AMP-binding protein [Bacillus]
MKLHFSLNKKDEEFIRSFNETTEEIQLVTLDNLFKNNVKAFPNKIAIEYLDEKITYKKLDEESNRVAHFLIEREITHNDFIGILGERSIKTIIMILGVLKAGAAYVPIESDYPEERRNYILLNSNCKLLLSNDFYERKKIFSYPIEDVNVTPLLENIAYVIYTSGSTGRPKGVVITHKAVSNTILDINRKFTVNENDKILGVSSMSFDLSVYDIFGAFAAGATLVLATSQKDVKTLYQTLIDKKITIWNSVPAIMDLVVDYAKSSKNELDLREVSIEKSINKQSKIDKNETTYCWSPSAHWEVTNEYLKVDKYTFTGDEKLLFPKLYYVTQKGMTMTEIVEAFPIVDHYKLITFLKELIDKHILVSSLLPFKEVFYPQQQLYTKINQKPNNYPENSSTHKTPINDIGTIQISSNLKEYPKEIMERKSHRKFSKSVIPFHKIAHILSVLKKRENNNRESHYYPSAGSLYPVEIYLNIKEGRIEGIPVGVYYFNSEEGFLQLIDNNSISKNIYEQVNQQIFQSSAISIYFVYNSHKNFTKYGSQGYLYAAIEAGILTSTVNFIAEAVDVGTCSIGDLHVNELENILHLQPNQTFIHAMELGLKVNDKEIESYEEYNQISETENNLKEFRNDFNNLRLVLLSGDWIPLKLPEKIKKKFPSSQVISLGGATEAAIWSIYYPIKEINNEWKSIPYGIPLANHQFYVMNYERELCPVGIKGDLYIGGIGLAEGYYNDEEKTQNAFINHPEFGKVYRTGDQGILNKNGYIEFLGRNDYQVKIRGHRIELGEIEHNILEFGNINRAIVIDSKEKEGRKHLNAYYSSNLDISPIELRKYLEQKIPSYMIPSFFVPIKDIPLTPNGKVDYKALPEPKENNGVIHDTSYTPPKTKLHKTLIEIWSDLLEVQSIGIKDDFFELGGHSLIAIKMQLAIESALGIEIEIHDVINQYPTIEQLALYLENYID